jgi:prevent-host-death family protein
LTKPDQARYTKQKTKFGQEQRVTKVNLYEAKTQLSRLVERAAAGEEIVIAKGGRPLARLVPLAQRTAPRELGFLAGRVRVSSDFDAPLPEDLAVAFGMIERGNAGDRTK